MPPVRMFRAPATAAVVAGLALVTCSPAMADDAPSQPSAPTVQIRRIQEQGTADREVTVHGYVTSDYSRQGIGGFYLQEPNTGGQPDPSVMTTQAVHVIGVEGVHVGDYVQVTGTVRRTATDPILESSGDQVSRQDAPQGASAPRPLTSLASIKGSWDDEASLERVAGMLVMPDAGFEVSGLDQYGLRGEARLRLDSKNQESKDSESKDSGGVSLILDDGAADEYTANGDTQQRVLPRWAGDRAPRIGDHTDFTGPSVLQHVAAKPGESDGWHAQPTAPVTDGKAALPARIRGTAPAARISAPSGDLSVAQVDLGNYFPRTGSVPSARGADCTATRTADGTPLALAGGGGCPFLGAADAASFQRQRSKVKALLTGMKKVDVIAVQGLQNDAQVGASGPSTIEGLAALLNSSGTDDWKSVAAPQGAVGLRSNGFLYRSDAVKPSGEPRISTDQAFAAASSPVAQAFRPASGNKAPVTLVSTRFSSQSASDYDGDLGQDQLAGQNADQRAAQAAALTRWLDGFDKKESVVVTGNLGSLDGEAPVKTIAHAGFSDLVAGAGAFTSQGTSATGNQTHVFVAEKLASDSTPAAKVWQIAAQSAPATGYASYGLNGSDLVDAASAERATAENPVLFALDLPRAAKDVTAAVPAARSGQDSSGQDSSGKRSSGHDAGSSKADGSEKGGGSEKAGDTVKGASTQKATGKDAPAEKDASAEKDAGTTWSADDALASNPLTGTSMGSGGRAPLAGGTTAGSLLANPATSNAGTSSSTGSATTGAGSGHRAPATGTTSDSKQAASGAAQEGTAQQSSAQAAGTTSSQPTGESDAAGTDAAGSDAVASDPTRDIRLDADGPVDLEATAARTPASDSVVVRVGLVALAIALAIAGAVAVVVHRRRSS